MKKGFTLIELIIVVIIIGVLGSIAVPSYLRAIERARVAKAKSALTLIAKAEKMRMAQVGSYVTCLNAQLNTALGSYIEMSDIQNNDDDWDYLVFAFPPGRFTAVAIKMRGSQMWRMLTLTDTGTWGGNFVY